MVKLLHEVTFVFDKKVQKSTKKPTQPHATVTESSAQG